MKIEEIDKVLKIIDKPIENGPGKVIPLREAIKRYVRPGMKIHMCSASTSCYGLMYELVRQFWGKRPNFTIIAPGFLTPSIPLIHGRLVKKLITSFTGDAHPSPSPNPIIQRAFRERELEIENWSLLSYTLRLKAGAMNVGFLPTRSIMGSSMEIENMENFKSMEDPFNEGIRIGMVRAIKPDISFHHAIVADPMGNAIIAGPLSENLYGAMASKGGVILTVEKIVTTEFIKRYSHMVRLPGNLVRSVSEVPFGAHPGALNSFAIEEVEGYGIDYEFIMDARKASREVNKLDEWIRYWILECDDRNEYLKRLGIDRILYLKGKARRDSWKYEFEVKGPDIDESEISTPTERMIIAASKKLMERVKKENYRTILAGIGASNLAAWLTHYLLKEEGIQVDLMAEVGFYGYSPRPMDPFIFNHSNIPTCKMATDTFEIMGIFMSGNPDSCIGALSAGQVDRYGNINTTMIPPDLFLTGSGGANDVVSGARESLVTAIQSKGRFVDKVAYITSPGQNVRTLVSDRGIYEKLGEEREFILTGILSTERGGSKEELIREIKAICGWDLKVAKDIVEIPPPSKDELYLLRSFDPDGYFTR
jgi:acyl CoA:acetate/3-ketoacid CoA transferase alpha subunit/acyl CoA:acetate/3-ketoacid CoA transferase beta subunit